MAHGLSCGFSAGRFSEKDEKKPSRQAGTAGEKVKTRVRIRYISRFYRPFHSRLLQFQKQKLPENSVMIAFFGEFFIFWYVDMFSSFYL
ncbi:MAG: hypothetical protein C6W57_01150 [Caldibacillus debilis]|nr:MAG: hypothetical protein C6W57_01150 [Caldibacillus debilis]